MAETKRKPRLVWIHNKTIHAITLEDHSKLNGGKVAKVRKPFAEMLINRGLVDIVDDADQI